MKAKRYKGSTGFTLIELIVAVIILAALAAVALPSFMRVHRDGKIVTLSSIAAQLEEQSQIAHLKALVDNIPAAGECTFGCDGHNNWSVTKGYYYIFMADGSKLFIRDSYPFYQGEEDTHFKPAMGLSDSQFVFVEGTTLKIIPRSWENERSEITNHNFKCYVEYENAAETRKNIITVHSADC
ncbi:prepilin-type N-terminal cleavage/methylation domain-containing protein [Moritella sp. 28]|uniref:prepilin-type N-terminal cleavage/methylation domain-containing protein n=1 Tax=Moritella sp. 28 TaxID=2746232 RepID=UPI001BA48F0C|nr:prepilin-type N-terminal cleavage/methylation domain-containing protein [Moritella sp. 28]QUM83959.1 prepilin-type N-terminal cleavage/methylation domain-containing protein [Moritella sp. 28]